MTTTPAPTTITAADGSQLRLWRDGTFVLTTATSGFVVPQMALAEIAEYVRTVAA